MLLLVAPSAAGEALSVGGIVRDVAGQPLAGVPVSLRPFPSLYQAGLARLGEEGSPGPAPAARSGRDGRFTLTVTNPGVYRVEVRPPGFVPVESGPIAVVEAVELVPVGLSEDAGCRFELRHRQDEMALEGIRVEAVTSRGSPVHPLTERALWEGWRPARRSGRTGADGELVLPCARGERLDLSLGLPWRSAPQRLAEVEDLRLLVATGVAPKRRLEVRGPDGAPLSGVLVLDGEDGWPLGRTGEDGALELRGELPEPTAIRLLTAAGQRHEVELGSGPETATVTFPPPETVAGRVAEASRRTPIAGALVWRIDDPGACVRTDEQGAYEMLAPAGSWLQADAAGFRPRRQAIPTSASGAWKDLLLLLDRAPRSTALARGEVADPAGQAVPGARVRLEVSGLRRGRLAEEVPPESPFSVLTDGAGRFELAAVPGPVVDVSVRAEGFAELVWEGVGIPRDERPADLGTLVLEPGVALSGRVRDGEGSAVAAASVWVVEGEIPPSARAALETLAAAGPDAESAADGSFSVVDLAEGTELHLIVDAAGYLPAAVHGIRVPAPEPLEVALTAGATVRGGVFDRDDEPLGGAAVTIRPADPPDGVLEPTGLAGGDEQTTESNADGSFELDSLAPGVYEVEALAAGFQPSEPEAVEVPAAGEVEGLRLVLARGATVSGRVQSLHGEPIVGASVRAGEDSAVTDVHGRYRLDGVPPGRRIVEARHPHFVAAARELEIGLGDNDVDLILEPGQPVRGRVLTDAGSPVAGASVKLTGGHGSPQYYAASDETGDFAFPGVAPGTYRLHGATRGYAPAESPGAVRVAGEPVEDLELVLHPGAVVTGSVLGLAAGELSRVRVAAEGPEGSTVPGRIAEDRYEIRDLAPGRWRLRALLPDGRREATARIAVEAGVHRTYRDLEFRTGLVLSGMVLHDGVPLTGARVTVESRDAVRREAVTDLRGSFRLEDLEAGRYRVEATSARELIVESRDVELRRDLDMVIDIRTVAVSGRVLSPTGEPVAEALVVFQRRHEGGDAGVYALATDPKGGFLVARLTVGRYRVSVRRDGYASAHENLEVATDLHGLLWELEPATAGGGAVQVTVE